MQSSLNLLYLIGFSEPNTFPIFGDSDEKFHIRGGNDQVPTILAAKLAGADHREHAARRRSSSSDDGTFKLTFQNGAGSFDSVYDHVVLALPFSILRSAVDFSQAGFNDVKTTAINERGDGDELEVPPAVHVALLARPGLQRRDVLRPRLPEHVGGHARAGRRERDPLLVHGRQRSASRSATARRSSRRTTFLRQIEPVLPGATAKWNGKVTRDYWTGYQWTKGSYSYWKVGQYTRFVGAEAERSGNCYFCGEHTSIDFQGYLNGAVDTGETAAKQVIRRAA